VKSGDLLIQLNADSDIAQLHALEAAAELAAITLKRDQAQLAVQGYPRPRWTTTLPT
jgi:membrane fusion protein (multidrug efflux system)